MLLGDLRKQDCHSKSVFNKASVSLFTAFAKLPVVASRKASSVVKEGHLNKKHMGVVRTHCLMCS